MITTFPRTTIVRYIPHLIFAPLTAYMFWWYSWAWSHGGLWQYFTERPYVYRVLIPLLAVPLQWLGVGRETAYILIAAAAFAGFAVCLYYLYLTHSPDKERATLGAYLGAWLLLFLTVWQHKPYDMTTAFLMTLSFLLIERDNRRALMWLFPLICLNKETAFFVALLFAVWHWRKILLSDWLMGVSFMGIVYVIIQASIRLTFASAPGTGNPLRLADNLQLFAASPLASLIHVSALALILWLVFRSWDHKPLLLRTAFLVIFPLLFVLYLVTGWAFEVRVFVEVFPVVYLLA